MEHARPPAELSLEGGPANRADAWRKWLRQFQVFLKASGVHKEPSDVQASLLINLIGPEGYDIFTTFKFAADEDKDKLEKIVEQFNAHFGTKSNTTMVRFKFFTRCQEIGESIDEYVTALKLLSQRCEFEQLEDSLLRDRIVCGVKDTSVRDRLLRTDELTLEKAVKICQANEISNDGEKQIEGIKTEALKSASVDTIWKGGRRDGRRSVRGASLSVESRRGRGAVGGGRGSGSAGAGLRGGGDGGGAFADMRSAASGPGEAAGPSARACAACASVHCDSGERCAARKVKCFNCGGKGHFKVMCPVRKSRKVYELYEDYDEDDKKDLYYISSLEYVDTIVQAEASKWYETLYLSYTGIEHRFKLDTGSDLNVLSKNDYIKLGLSMSNVIKDHTRAKSFCGNFLSIIGSCIIKWMYKNVTYNLKFIISEQNGQSILGKDALEQIGLVKRVFSLNLDNYKNLFRGLGKLPGTYTIPIESNASPCICPVRKIPLGVRDQLKEELTRMERLGVIRKVHHPTSWVNGIVMAGKKDGSFRICLDPRPLNRVIRRQHYPLPTLTEIATKLKGARYFSKLDAKSGFWMIQLDDKSADLCTFGTPFGRYQYLRLPYGINSASEVFHARVRQLLEDLEGVDSFVDDVIVWGSTKEEHDERLRSLLERANEVGIKFNPEKCEFGVNEVTYLGHRFSIDGMKIDQTKLKAITNMPSPTDRSSLERFLGMVNYVSKFIPHYSEKVAPLRNLLKKDSEWCWGECEEVVVSELKRALCAAPVLALFEPREPAVLSVDASARALGAVLLQAGRPVEFASMTLTDTQQRYAQIEKEMLAIVFALERFHQYIFGKNDVIVETDHKPLEALFKKSLDSVPARLQRMMLRVQRYDFQVKYTPGKYMFVADTLSRAPLPDLLNNKVSEELEEQTCFLIQNLRFSGGRLETVRVHTERDEECQTLINYVLNGWPINKYNVKEIARPHWSYRECLEYVDGTLLMNNLVFIPKTLRSEMIERVHEGHLGIDRCKRRARDVMFWPGMSRDVERAVRACRVCSLHAPLPQREPIIAHHIPGLPWAKIGSDIFEVNKKYFLILVDYFSNFVEVSPLTSISSKQVILAMRDQFARHGIPQELISDNGPAYSSKEFRNFVENWGFKHSTSSPNYPQSNGRSERAVRTIKGLISKSVHSNEDFYLSLLNYRATPRDGIASPAQLLMGRRLNTRLPCHHNKLLPERDNTADYNNLIRNQIRSKSWYDSRARPLPELKVGDNVVALEGPRREYARVLRRAAQPRSYFVLDGAGRVLRRNRRHLVRVSSPDPEPSPATSSQQTTCEDDVTQEDTGLNHSSSESECYDSCPELYDNVSPKSSVGQIQNKRTERAAARVAKEKLKFMN